MLSETNLDFTNYNAKKILYDPGRQRHKSFALTTSCSDVEMGKLWKPGGLLLIHEEAFDEDYYDKIPLPATY